MAKKNNGRFRAQSDKLIRSRDLQQIISTSQSLTKQEVKDVLDALVEVVFLSASRGYEVSIPNLGFFTSIEKKGKKKGETLRLNGSFGKNAIKNPKQSDDYIIKQDDNGVYIEYIKDQPDYRIPHFTFYKGTSEKVKEESRKWV